MGGCGFLGGVCGHLLGNTLKSCTRDPEPREHFSGLALLVKARKPVRFEGKGCRELQMSLVLGLGMLKSDLKKRSKDCKLLINIKSV